jgi:L-seryl-tRNA(Ser) seleniumtransferase
LEAALSERTALVLFVAGDHLAAGALGLAETVAIAHARGVPVVVDAAAQLPPVENLWRFSRDLGADLVVFSGGKELRGPQASGLLVGRADLIEGCRVHGSPHQRLGRPMKVGKEEMVGLLAAVERYLALDHSARFAGFEATVARWLAACADLPGVAAAREFPNEAGQPVPRLRLTFDPAHTDLTGPEAQHRLWEGTPAIAVALAGPHAISLTPDCLDGDDEGAGGGSARGAPQRTVRRRLSFRGQVLPASGVARSPTFSPVIPSRGEESPVACPERRDSSVPSA